MIHYSVVPEEIIFEGWAEMNKEYVEVQRPDCVLVVEPTGWGEGVLVQLISSNPSLYLEPSLQPGNRISFLGNSSGN